MDNNIQEVTAEGDADRPAEPAGANGDGGPESDSKLGDGGRVNAPVDHQVASQEAEDSSVEEGSDAELHERLENYILPGAGEIEMACVRRDNSTVEKSDSTSPNLGLDCENTGEVILQSIETGAADVLPVATPTISTSAIDDQPASDLGASNLTSKEGGIPLDSLDNSSSSLESVSIDGSFHSGNTLVLRGDVLAQEQDLSLRDDANIGGDEDSVISNGEVNVMPEGDVADDGRVVYGQGLTEPPVTGGDGGGEVRADTGEEDGGVEHESYVQHATEEQQTMTSVGVDTWEHSRVPGEGDNQSRRFGVEDKNLALGGQPTFSSAFPSDTLVADNQSTQSVTESAQSVTQSAQSVTQPAHSVTQPAQNVTQSAKSVTQSAQSVTQSGQSVTQPDQCVTQPDQSVTQPAQSVTSPVQSITKPVQAVPQSKQCVPQSADSLQNHVLSVQKEADDVQVSAPRGSEEDGTWQHEPSHLHSQTGSTQRHPEFPFNYNNYKVCRQVEPGVKECLILETGEHVTCRKSSPLLVTPQSSDEEDSSSAVNLSSGDHTPEHWDAEAPPKSRTESPKSGFKIIHKNQDGTSKFGSLILGATDTPLAEAENFDDKDCHENMLMGSPKLDFRSRSASEPLSPRGIKNTINRSPRSGNESSSTNAVYSRRGYDSPGLAGEGSRGRQVCVSSPGNQLPHSSSESSSAQESAGIHDLADLRAVQDIYETESDLRPGFEGGPGTGHFKKHTHDTSYQTHYRDAVQDRAPEVHRSSTVPSPRSQKLSHAVQQDKIDMSALYRAERWLDERKARAVASPQQQNLSMSVSSTASGPIPGFRTLQEQQASWMKMFKMLEDQHQSDLVTQYKQHQRNIQHLQEQIEDDLCRQQDSFQKKLDVHRELLLHNSSFAESYLPCDIISEESEAAGVTGRRTAGLPRPFLRDDEDDDNDDVEEKLASGSAFLMEDSRLDDLVTVSLSQEKGRGSAHRHLQDSFEDDSTQVALTSRSAVQEDVSSRVLGSGVNDLSYPLTATSRHFSPVAREAPSRSLRVTRGEEEEDLVHSYINDPRHSTLLHDASVRSQALLHPVSPPAGEGNTSSNARMSLREKHAKHLSDLRSYYERELQELRTALTSPEYIKSQSPYKQVMEVNLELQGRLEVQEDEISALKRANRELESKVQTLQNRLDDTLEKYEESQVTLGAVRRHLDEVQVLCKEKESMIKHLEADNSRLSTALKDAYKMQDQQMAEAKRQEASMNRLAERHDNLNRENESNKEALSQMDGKLYDSRMEIVQLKRMISKLELENNRLGRENNNLRHKGLISSLGLSTFYPQSGQESGLGVSLSPETPQASHTLSYTMGPRCVQGQPSPDVSEIVSDNQDDLDPSVNGESDIYHSPPRGNQSPPQGGDIRKSPLVKAEEDLRTLRKTIKENLGQSLVQQRSVPRSSGGSGRMNGVEQRESNSRNGSPSMSFSSSSTKSSPKNGVLSSQPSSYATQQVGSDPTTIIDTLMSRSTPQRKLFTTNVDRHLPSGGTPTRFDIDVWPAPSSRTPSSSKKRTSPVKRDKAGARLQQSNKDVGVNPAVASTLEKMKAGEFVTRPSWENRDTTTVRGGKAVHPGGPKHREEKVQERLRAIRDLEVKYDDLQVEKRQLESALSKVPLHGKVNHHNRKEKEDLDNQLDKVERELGSVRMSLKRYHVLKTSGH